jgi:hypothetical protein
MSYNQRLGVLPDSEPRYAQFEYVRFVLNCVHTCIMHETEFDKKWK